MAIDTYLQLSEIKGESSDDKHKDWIEIQSIGWSIDQPKSASSSTSGGHTAERCKHNGITITKVVDVSSPQLMQHCSTGKTFPKAKIEFFRADGDNRVKYFEIEMENVLISHIGSGLAEGSTLTETVQLAYSKIKWLYTKQRIGGGAQGVTSGGWDLATNRVAA